MRWKLSRPPSPGARRLPAYVASSEARDPATEKISEAGDIFVETAREYLNDKNEEGFVFSLAKMASRYSAWGESESAARLIA